MLAPQPLQAEAKHLSQRGAAVLPKIEADLHQSLRRRVTLVLLPRKVPEVFRDLDRAAPTWAAGFMLPLQRIGAIRMDRVTSYPFDNSEMVLVHEITHLLLHDKVGRSVPRWFDEAVATREGRNRGARDLLFFATATTLWSRTPSLASLDRAFSGSASEAGQAYAVSFEFLNWATRKYGPDLVVDVLDATARLREGPRAPMDTRTPYEAAWQETTGVPLEISEQRWRRSAYRFTRWLPIVLTSNWLWVGMAILSFLGFLTRRRQKLAQYRRWEEEETLSAQPIGLRDSALSSPASEPTSPPNGDEPVN